MSENTSQIAGNSNINLQGISARDIIINIAKDLPPEVKQQKETLQAKIKLLVDDLVVLDSMATKNGIAQSFIPPEDNPAYEAFRWRRLLQALRHQGCILFLGPEISVNGQGKSLHQEFYKDLAKDFDEIEYLVDEGFFSPGSDEEILYDILDFYNKDFPKKNVQGRNLIEKLAQVPFSLIISLCPDDTVRRIYEEYDLNHQFLAFDGTRQEVDLSDPARTIIYNILGNAASNGRYIFTHENFYNYLNKVSIPAEIKKKIQDATHYLFVGFDFDKWYNRLLLFILDFEQKKSGAHRLTVGNKNVRDDVEKFISRQFNITFVDNDFQQFTEWLIYNVREEGILRNLNEDFIRNNFLKLKSLSSRISAEDNPAELLAIEKKTVEVESRIAKFKLKFSS